MQISTPPPPCPQLEGLATGGYVLMTPLWTPVSLRAPFSHLDLAPQSL